MTIDRTYSELLKLQTFSERFRYLSLGGVVGEETFGFDRYLNQVLYTSDKWREARRKVIIRDNGNDLGLDGFPIGSKIIVHHINPITRADIINRVDEIFDPEYLISCSLETHNAIHYGDFSILDRPLALERKPNDTIPWKK